MRYTVEMMTYVYVSITVDAADAEAAESAADAALPRSPVIVELSEFAPAGSSVTISKDWEVNSVEDTDGNTER